MKQDGTLWGWGYNGSTNYTIRPVRLGVDSDWSAVFSGEGSALFVKQDGEVWQWLEETVEHKRRMVRMNLNGADWNEAENGLRQLLVIRQDGSLWVRSRYSERIFVFRFIPVADSRNGLVRVGKARDWVQVSAEGPTTIGIKTNGRLVKSGTELFGSTLGRLSAHRGWIAIDAYFQNTVALNADGTISLWCDTRAWTPSRLLASTHRPLWNLNIFSDSKK